MRDNRRRNRNIGTAKQGYGQNNRLCISDPGNLKGDDRGFSERLTQYKKTSHTINGHEFIFIVEKVRPDCCHACTVADVARMLSHIPVKDYGDLRFIIFRQPKRKEEILSPVWARLNYDYEFEHTCKPAVILEAFNTSSYITWPRSMTVDGRNEFERLQKDGHVFIADKRIYRARLRRETVRATQLYRSLPHEFGHYVQYQQCVNTASNTKSGLSDRWTALRYYHFSIPEAEKEKFAHSYADRLREALLEKGVIPFSPQE
jgi:hypothetical protein